MPGGQKADSKIFNYITPYLVKLSMCTDSHMLKPISKDDVGIQCEFMMCSAQSAHRPSTQPIGAGGGSVICLVGTSVGHSFYFSKMYPALSGFILQVYFVKEDKSLRFPQFCRKPSSCALNESVLDILTTF